MPTPGPSQIVWRKSSRSVGASNCIEVAGSTIRDSKNPAGPVLALAPGELASFLTAIKASSFDLP